MTLVRMQARSARANPAPRTVDDAMEPAGPQVCDDMTVEVALSVMASARAVRLLVFDEHGLYTGLVTRDRLTAIRNSSAYTDRLRLRESVGGHGPFAAPMTTPAEADQALGHCRLDALPVVDGPGGAPGVLALAR